MKNWSNEHFTVELKDGVCEFTLHAGKANAISANLSRQMGLVFQDFRDDDAARVLVITARGEKFFCPGWDLKGAAAGEAPDSDYGVGGFAGLQELPNMNKPIIAAINGIACGGGFEWMISCDLIIAADHATFALPEINVGVFADAATIKLPRRIPYHIAMEMLLLGRWMKADEAHRWGLVNEVVAKENLLPRAREIARMLADGPPLVFHAIKEVVRDSLTLSIQESFNKTRDGGFPTVYKCNHSEDMLEGTRAFAEKRKPKWQGK
ncbi:MAG: carnitinyl-CoA dehydratase [Hydrotalea sp.]|nr:carnitinyl-CoA dehydratase [Hydrotalea sp.]